MIKVGSDFSGVGAFNQALNRLGIDYEEVYACDMDKYARQTYIHNYGEPKYYPLDVYDRQIPIESLDIYMTSPPCQAFSSAGQKHGKNDKRGILFFNSLEFIEVNKPRYFIFENVKGLLSDDNGKTFSEWINLLGGKSVNGNTILFPYQDSVPYHIYWDVLNAKDYGVPQNRERVFIVGIRNDSDNNFRFPISERLEKSLAHIIEENIPLKYYLSKKMISGFENHNKNHNDKGTGFIYKPKNKSDIANCLRANAAICPTDNTLIDDICRYGFYSCANVTLCDSCEDGSNYELQECFNNKSLNNTIKKSRFELGEQIFIDSHNETIHDYAKTITTRVDASNNSHLWDGYRIRKLTPRECFRLMDFPDSFTWTCSDAQAYKQAGNSIVVNVLYKIIKNLNL